VNNGKLYGMEKNGKKSHEKIFYVQYDLYEQELQLLHEQYHYGIGPLEVKKRKQRNQILNHEKKKSLFGRLDSENS
jgi:hypothetical protein